MIPLLPSSCFINIIVIFTGIRSARVHHVTVILVVYYSTRVAVYNKAKQLRCETETELERSSNLFSFDFDSQY